MRATPCVKSAAVDPILSLGGRTLYTDPGCGGGCCGGCCGGSTIGSYDFLLARLNDDGSLDPTFDGDGKVLTDFGSSSGQGMYDSDYSLVIQPDDGKIVAAGDSYDALNGGRDFAIARYHPDGSLDTTFAGTGMLRTDFRSGTDDTAYAVKLQLARMLHRCC